MLRMPTPLRRPFARSISAGGRYAKCSGLPERRMIMKSLLRLFRSEPNVAEPLYRQVVAKARQPHWYVEGGVPDTKEGRFAMLATLLALTDLRLEQGGEDAIRASVALAECFVHDMDSQLRQDGVGDPVMGKRVGSLVGALGGQRPYLRPATGAALAASTHPHARRSGRHAARHASGFRAARLRGRHRTRRAPERSAAA